MSASRDDSHARRRRGPPWVMEEMIAAQAELPSAIAAQAPAAVQIAERVRAADANRWPVVVTGCGTSEHAAQAIAALVDDALGRPHVEARQALDAAAVPREGGICIGVSHEGETPATVAALAAARSAGATTALVTAAASGPAARHAALVLVTPLLDRSWCHTVGYVSPVLAGALVAAALAGRRFEEETSERVLASPRAAQIQAGSLAGAQRLLAAGADVDAITARELALKVAEGAHLPTTAVELENVLHGHLVAHDGDSALVVVATGAGGSPAARRAAHVVAAARRIGLATAAVRSREVEVGADLELTFDLPDGASTVLSRLLGGAIALQLLTVALAHARGVNPDVLRRDERPHREAGATAESDAKALFLQGTSGTAPRAPSSREEPR